MKPTNKIDIASQNAISSVTPKYAVTLVVILNTIFAKTPDFQDGSFSCTIVRTILFLGFMLNMFKLQRMCLNHFQQVL